MGRVDRALCSVVLEAGLSCKQAAALEWQDLGRGAGASPTLTIRTESSEAGEVIGISATARDDLEAIARVRAPYGAEDLPDREAGDRNSHQIGGAELQDWKSWWPMSGRHRVVRAETTDKISATDRTRECKWRAFSTWCTEHGAMALPASAETGGAVPEGTVEGTEQIGGLRQPGSHCAYAYQRQSRKSMYG